jgi:HEAT repeat protein
VRGLSDKDAIVRARAAYELGRGGVTSAVPALGKAAADESLLVRVAAIRALDWLAQVPAAKPLLQSLAPQLAAQLAAEQGHVQTVRVNEELRRLHTRLARL